MVAVQDAVAVGVLHSHRDLAREAQDLPRAEESEVGNAAGQFDTASNRSTVHASLSTAMQRHVGSMCEFLQETPALFSPALSRHRLLREGLRVLRRATLVHP